MLFSKSCEYAIQAVLYLTVKGDGATPIHLRAITHDLRVPHHFLSKVLQILSRHEIIRSFRGSSGGFLLGRHPSQITLAQVAIAVDGNAFLDHCVLGYSKCSEHDPCPAHNEWAPVKKLFLEMIEQTTFEKMSREWDGKFEKLGLPMPKLKNYSR